MPGRVGRYHGRGNRRWSTYTSAALRGVATAYRHRRAARAVGAGLRRAAHQTASRIGSGMRGIKRRLFGGPSQPHHKRHRAQRAPVAPYARGSGGNQYSRTSKKTGISRKKSAIQAVLAKQSLRARVLQFKGLRPFDGVNGYYFNGTKEVTAPWASYLTPIYIMDLMPSSAVNEPLLRGRVDAGQFSWVSQAGQKVDGTTAQAWDLKFQNAGFPAQTSIEKMHYGKCQIAINLYGQKSRPITWTIKLVKFQLEDCAPLDDDYATNMNKIDHDIFWDGMIKQLTANPIAKDNAHHMAHMKVLKTKVVKIDAAGTYDQDNDVHCTTLNWTHGIHKTVNLVRRRENEDAAADLINEALVNPTVNTVSAGPRVNERVYLLITSDCYTRTDTATAVSSANSPSFDLNVHMAQYALN